MSGARIFLCLAVVLTGRPSEDAPSDPRLALRRTPIVEACEKVRDAVVNITASQEIQVQRWGGFALEEMFNLPRRPMTTQRTNIGSGFVIHPAGYIVTNAHVAAQGADLEVSFADGARYAAEVVARDTRHDLAVLKIEAPRPLTTIPLGRSDDLMIGETTIAVGNPVGMQNTVTTGVISALHRDLDFNGRVLYGDLIQTDAGINPGNSGGPLLNVLGELIGVNTAIRTDAYNIGFAIPVDQLRRLMPDLLDPEKVKRTQLGLRVAPDEPRIMQVRGETPAARAGLAAGDVLLSLDDRPLSSGTDFYLTLLARNPGDVVNVRFVRDGRQGSARIRLEPMPALDGRQLAQRLFGVRVENLSQEVASRLGWSRDEGVVVTEVEADSPASRAGLQPGDLLYTLGSYRVRSVEQFGSLIESFTRGMRADVGIVRVQRARARLLEGQIVAR